MANIVGCYSIPDVNDNSYPELVHDHNITILNEGKLIRFLHLERFSRIKYDSGLNNYFESIARELKLIPAKDTVFVFVDHEIGRSFISKTGKIRVETSINDKLSLEPERARLYWFGEWPEAYVINHELAHLYSCIPFYGNFKNKSILVHFDGGASQSNFSAWRYDNGKLKMIEAHYQYKWLSSLFNANALVFAIVNTKKREQNAVPGKFMGLEAYGSYSADIEKWLKENNFFSDIWGSKDTFFKSVKKKFNISLSAIDNKNQLIQNIAATVHEIFIREMLEVFKRLKLETSAEYLYYSGGSALNIKLNAKLIKENLFHEIYIPPCTNDSGLSLGAAAAVSMIKGISVEKVSPYLNNFQIIHTESFTDKNDIKHAADLLARGGIVGICNGYGEAGPRALGIALYWPGQIVINLQNALVCN
jgi:carbamoyltransferase